MTQRGPSAAYALAKDHSLADVLALERVDGTLFRTTYLLPDPYPMFGGQLAAQALLAAGLTVAEDRAPHSLHAYFLRPGDASQPVEYAVSVDRDGRGFSARRVVAQQRGKVVLTLSASFHIEDEEGPSDQRRPEPLVSSPEIAEPWLIPRLLSHDGRLAEQEYPHHELMTRFWARCTADLGGDRLLNACALAYVSDISSGVAHFDTDTHASHSSLDHALWFHRPVSAGQWLLLDLIPEVVSRGRGWYTGTIFDTAGNLVASFAQETLFVERPSSYFPL